MKPGPARVSGCIKVLQVPIFYTQDCCTEMCPIWEERKWETWPKDGRFLIAGFNDSWNCFQKFNKGKLISTADWRLAREALRKSHEEFVANGGVAEQFPAEWHRSIKA